METESSSTSLFSVAQAFFHAYMGEFSEHRKSLGTRFVTSDSLLFDPQIPYQNVSAHQQNVMGRPLFSGARCNVLEVVCHHRSQYSVSFGVFLSIPRHRAALEQRQQVK